METSNLYFSLSFSLSVSLCLSLPSPSALLSRAMGLCWTNTSVSAGRVSTTPAEWRSTDLQVGHMSMQEEEINKPESAHLEPFFKCNIKQMFTEVVYLQYRYKQNVVVEIWISIRWICRIDNKTAFEAFFLSILKTSKAVDLSSLPMLTNLYSSGQNWCGDTMT